MEYILHATCPLGKILLSSDGEALSGLWFEGQKYYASSLSGMEEECSLPIFEDVLQWLDIYFSGRIPDFRPRLSPKGTPFRQEVWDLLLDIPYGRTISYGELATEIANRHCINRMSARAVGGAVGHNPISIIIPCHRVIGSKGELVSYAGGVDKKQRLLRLEGIDI